MAPLFLKALTGLRRLRSSLNATELHQSSTGSSFAWLTAYFATNLALTIYNKLVLAGNFPFPYTLTAIHCFFGTLGSYICLKQGMFNRARLTYGDTALVTLFSVLYTVNIIVSNLSLYVSYGTNLIVDSSSQSHSIKSYDLPHLCSSS
jgi:hypothetical protein